MDDKSNCDLLMNQKQILTLAVVVVVIIAAAGVYLYASMSKDDGGSVASLGGSLEVYGNANGDYYIDDKDTEVIERIITDGLDWKSDYPFADANCDGVVNQADVDQVNKIIGATADNPVTIWHNNWNPSGRCVTSTTYPITAAAISTAQTTAILLKTLGIDDEIVGSSFTDSRPASSDKYVYADYFDIMTEDRRIGNASTGVNVDTASNLVTKYGASAYIYSSSSTTLSNLDLVEGAGIDCVQLPDGMSDVNEFNCAVLLLAFLFDTGNKGYMDKAVDYVEWMNSYWKEFQDNLSAVYDGRVEQKSGAASSMSVYVSVKGSSNTDIIEQAGLSCPVSNTESSGTTLKYTGGTDTWLNNLDLDYLIILKGSSSGWSWFDEKYGAEDLPQSPNSSSYQYHMNNFSSLQCYKEGNVFIVSSMMPGPLKSAIIAQYVYPELFDDGWAESFISEYYQKYLGFSQQKCENLKYILTEEDVF